jgi:hypothetical protein
MKSSDVSRRRMLAGATTMAVGLAAGAGLAPRIARAADTACGGLSRSEFMEYMTLFNSNDPSFTKFYHDDVVLELGTEAIRTAKGIRDFYAEVKTHIREKVDVALFISDATGIAVELPTEFRVIKDWENGFFKRPLKVGEVMRTVSWVLYNVQDRKFKHIRSTRYKQVHDWRMES